MNEEKPTPKWQPVLLVLNERLECQCGVLAIFVTGTLTKDGYNVLKKVDCWCQDCFARVQEEEGNEASDEK